MRAHMSVTSVAAGMLLVGLLGGCGDDSVSKETFLAAAGKICKGIDTKLIELDKSVGEVGEAGPTPEQQQAIVKGAGAIFKEAANELDELEKPKEDTKDSKTLESFVKAMHTGADEVLAAGATREKAVALLESDKDPMQKANELADTYGLTECGGQ